jgi:hypothetical protein
MAQTTPEKASSSPSTQVETGSSVVVQPSRVEFAALLDGIGKISEQSAGGPAHDGATSGGGVVAKGQSSGQSQVSARDLAIAALPVPAVMQKALEKHIQEEVKKLRKQAKAVARIGNPGGAYRLNQLYTRIHHLNAILAGLFEASIDVVKRLFVRVFIDRQTIQ